MRQDVGSCQQMIVSLVARTRACVCVCVWFVMLFVALVNLSALSQGVVARAYTRAYKCNGW